MPSSAPLLFFISLLIILPPALSDSPSFDPDAIPSHADLKLMTTEQLMHVDRLVLSRVKSIDAQILELRGEAALATQAKSDNEKESEKLKGARAWEAGEKAKNEASLGSAKKELVVKQEAMAKLSVHVAELKNEIIGLKDSLEKIKVKKELTEKKFYDPSLADIFDAQATKLGPVSKKVYEKTVTKVLPSLSTISTSAASFYTTHATPSATIFAAITVYGFCLLSAYLAFRLHAALRTALTLSHLLFFGDAFAATFWLIILLSYLILRADPLIILQARNDTIFFIFQLVVLVSYVAFALLRVVVLAAKMTIPALGELLTVIVVGHHYYIRVWQPAIVDGRLTGSVVYYLCYAWLFALFAYQRLDDVIPARRRAREAVLAAAAGSGAGLGGGERMGDEEEAVGDVEHGSRSGPVNDDHRA